jgi:hypothetical protein
MSATAATVPAESESNTFRCPQCGGEHPWAPEFAGRTARCACGHVLKVPRALAGPTTKAREPTPVPAPVASGGMSGIMSMRSAMSGGDEALSADVEAELAAVGKYGEEDLTRPDPRRDTYVPLVLIGIGLAVAGVDFGYTMRPGAAVAAAVLVTGFKLIVGMVLMLGSALLAARFAGINFGPIGPALLKLAGLCLAPSALGDLYTSLVGGDMAVSQIGWVVRFVLTWALVSYLFRLDGMHTAIVVFTITVVKLLAFVFIGSLFALSFASFTTDSDLGGGADDDSAITSLEDDGSALEESSDD